MNHWFMVSAPLPFVMIPGDHRKDRRFRTGDGPELEHRQIRLALVRKTGARQVRLATGGMVYTTGRAREKISSAKRPRSLQIFKKFL